MDKTRKCPVCGGEFEGGVLADSGDYLQKRVVEWGENITTLGFGLKNSKNVTTFRCKNCGYLESYAK